MSQVKLGSIVKYSAFGRVAAAIVLALRTGEVSHLGSNGEPILTLALIDPARETGLSKDEDGEPVYPIGRLPNVFIEHDVVHASHEFSDEFKHKHGHTPAQIASQRGHGEWSEYEGEEASTIRQLREVVVTVCKQRNDAQDEVGRQRARADLAESKLGGTPTA